MEEKKKEGKMSPGDVWLAGLGAVVAVAPLLGPAAPIALLGYAVAGVCAGMAEEEEKKEDC